MNDSRRCGVLRIRNAMAKFVNDIASAHTRTGGSFRLFPFFFSNLGIDCDCSAAARLVMIIINLRLVFRICAVCTIETMNSFRCCPTAIIVISKWPTDA